MSIKTQSIKRFITAVLFVAGAAAAQQKTFHNPIITGMNPDPSICRVEDDYYLVTSTFEYFPGLPIYHSKDLVHWKLIGHAVSSETQNPLKGSASSTGGQYAPSIRYHNGTFYVIGTNYNGTPNSGLFYVTATDPAGPWSEPIWLKQWNIDPSLLFADDTCYYVVPDEGVFRLAELDTKTGKFLTPLTEIAKGLGGASPEGPHLYKIGEYYYLMHAEGGTGYLHHEVMQRSKSPWGPYEAYEGNPFLTHKDDPDHPFQAIGHADLVETPDGWWLVCLGIRPRNGNFHNLGRETFLAPVTWTDDGWPRVEKVKEVQARPNLPWTPWPEAPARDDFNSDSLDLKWNFIRNPSANDWSLTDNPGHLRLYGSAVNFSTKDSPAFIGLRQNAFDISASAQLTFTPNSANEEAGLVVRGNDANHYDLVITKRAGKRVILLRQYLEAKEVAQSFTEIGQGDVILRITSTDREYTFWVQEKGKPAILIGTAATKNLSPEIISGFTGTFIGMYASGNGKPNTNHADFDWFDYEANPSIPTFKSITSPAYDKARLEWNRIENATGYRIERYSENKYETIATVKADQTTFTDSEVKGGTVYLYRITATNPNGASHPSITTSVLTLPTPGPFFGTPSQIPGKIEAENFDHGEFNKTCYDSDTVNTAGKYRTDGTDIELCWDTGNTHNICKITDGEWVVYTVDVNKPVVDIHLRVASPIDGRIQLELDGKTIAETDIKSTGGWNSWNTTTLPQVKMNTGKGKQLKVVFIKGGFNLNWMSFE